MTSVAGVPGTETAVTVGYDGAVGLVDLISGKHRLLGYHDHLVNHIAVSADGRLAASSSSDHSTQLWNLDDDSLVAVLAGHGDDVEGFAFLDGEHGVSASRDRRLIVWHLPSATALFDLSGHERDVLSVASAGDRIVSTGDDATLRTWDRYTGAPLSILGPFPVETDTCAVDLFRDRAILGADDGVVRVFDLATQEQVAAIAAHDVGIKKVAVNAGGEILSAAYDQRLLLWEPETFTLVAELVRPPGVWERSISWTPDGRSVLAGTFDGTVVTWRVR